jgi:hypothetical protein
MDFLSEAIRGASPGVSSMNITQLHNCATGAFALTSNAAVAGLPNTSDQLTVVMPHGSVVTSLTAAYNGTTSVAVAEATGLTVGTYLLITDFNTGHLVKVTGGTGTGPQTLTVDSIAGCTGAIPTGGYPIGAMVIRALRARFYVEVLSGDTVPMLMMDPDGDPTTNNSEPIAEGIENMEVAFGVDTNGDGVLAVENATPNNDEWLGNVAGETVYTTQTNVRAIRITLVARTTKEAMGVNTYRLPAIEDRDANVATDNFRRRILRSTIEVRNLGGSP